MTIKIIGVIGHTGMVGTEVYSYFKKKGYQVLGYSKDRKSGLPQSSWREINENCDIVFVCVPTPYDFKKKKSDFSIVDDVLRKITSGKTVVIKSTIWPGMTNQLQEKYPQLKLLFNPEFLSRKDAKRDFKKPDRQIVGYTDESKNIAKKVLRLLPRGKYENTVKAAEAELIKYAHNVYGSVRIIYANHLYEVSKKLAINYEVVKDGFSASEFIGPGILRYMTIFHNNKRGYGGPCFPKDVNSFIEFCRNIGVDAELVKATRRANRRILAEQSLTEKMVEKM